MAAADKEQVELATKLASLMDRMASSSGKIDANTSDQVASMEKLAQAMSALDMRAAVSQLNEVSQGVKAIVDKMGELAKSQQETLDQLGKKAVEAGTQVSTLTGRMTETKLSLDEINKMSFDKFLSALENSGSVTAALQLSVKKLGGEASKKFPMSMAVAAAATSGLVQGFKNLVALSKGVMGFMSSLVGGIGSVAGAIIAIPFKMFKGLIDMANNAGGGSSELAQAIEDLRKEFGALGTGSPKIIMNMATELKGFAATGLDSFRIFGNVAERLKAFLKLAQGMGPLFQSFAQEFKDNGGAILAWQKGLGLSDEQMKSIGQQAKVMGKSMASVLLPMQKQAQDLGAAFGIDSKLISRDMTKALGDMKHFAGAAVKEIAQASVYARKLGLELHDITGTLDAFETFDTAAENASKLSQAFGLNVDAFQLMEAQDPAKQVDMLRKSMAAAGQDASTFNRQQLKLLSSSTGLTEEQARMAFSMKNQGVGLDEIKKKSESAEKKQLSQADAMKKLADSIERLVQSGGGSQGGFFERFFRGFLGGIQASKGFRDIIMNIKMGLIATERAGVKLGRAFAALAPIKDVLEGIAALFQPGKFGKLFGGISTEFAGFFKDMTTGTGSIKGLMDNIQRHFLDFFSTETGPGKRVIQGFKRVFEAIFKILTESIKFLAPKMADVIRSIASFITDPKKFMEAAGGATSGFMATAIAFLKPLGEALVGAVRVLLPALMELGSAIVKKLAELWGILWAKPEVKAFVAKAAPAIALVLFGPALTRGLLGFITTQLGTMLLKSVMTAFTGPAAEAAGSAGTKGLGKVLTKSLGSLGKFLGPAAIIAVIADLAVNVDTAMKKFEDKLAPTFGKTEAKVGSAATGIINALTLGLLPDGVQELIAVSIAGLAKNVFSAVENFFGKSFTDRLKAYLSAGIDLFASIGNLIKTIFKGNEGDIADALMDVGEKFLKYVGNWLLFLAESIPTLAVKMLAFGTKLLSAFWGVLGKLFAKGADLPIVGPVFEMISKYFTVLSTVMGKISGLFSDISAAFKSSGVVGAISDFLGLISTVMSAAWNVVKTVWSTVGSFFTDNVLTPLSSIFNKVLDVIPGVFRKAWDIIATVFGLKPVMALFELVVEGITNALNKLLDIPVFKNLIEIAKKAFKISSPSKVFEDIGDDIAKGFDKGTDKMPQAMAEKMKKTGEAAQKQAKPIGAQVADATKPAGKGEKIEPAGGGKAIDLSGLEAMKTNVAAAGKLLKELATSPDMLPAVTGALKNPVVAALAAAKPQLEILQSTFGLMSELLGSIKRFAGSIPAGPAALDPLVKTVADMALFISRLVNTAAFGTSKPPLVELKDNLTSPELVAFAKAGPQITNLKSAFTSLNELMGQVSDFSKRTVDVSKGFNPDVVFVASVALNHTIETVRKMGTSFTAPVLADIALAAIHAKAFGDSLTVFSNSGVAAMVQGLKAISDMVNNANKLNEAMGSLPDLKLDAKLKSFATGIGLGGKFNYQIKNKDVVMNVSFTVTMNADDLEKSMVLREKSIIRDRLNFATSEENHDKSTSPLPPNQGSPVQIPAQPK